VLLKKGEVLLLVYRCKWQSCRYSCHHK